MKDKKKKPPPKKTKRPARKNPVAIAATPPPLADLHAKAKKLRELARAAERAAGGKVDRHREVMASRSRDASEHRRDIGPIPDIADPGRREKCSQSLKLFCQTYNPEAFALPWADYQDDSIARIEEAVWYGALYAMAEPRGGGKTTRVRMAALWAVANAFHRYVFPIGATDQKAADTLDALKMFLRFLPLLSADYPEISYPIQRLEGIANRASGQTSQGQPTLIEWTADRIVLPTVLPPANWPKRWPLRADGMVPTSGSLVATSGLTGEGIRGSLKTLTTGEQVRPDLVLLDDPQTNESARSRTQNQTRIQLISADVLGMAGPGKTISAIMPCTIIAPGDAMDHLTDRAKHPSWRGSRTRMLRTLPKNMAAWDRYFEVYRRCLLKEPPDLTEANEHYLANRPALDDGAEASWRERKLPSEVSAIQSAMHLYFRDKRAFMAEYQNDPDPIDLGQIADLSAAEIGAKFNKLPRLTAPRAATRLTAMIDVQAKVLYYVVCAWAPDFSGAVIDYGTWPKQTRAYFAADDARPSLADLFPEFDETARIFAGLKALVAEMVGKEYPHEGGGSDKIGLCLVDSGKWSDTIHEACRQSAFSALLLPSKGYGIGAGAAPMANWQVKPGERATNAYWRIRPTTEGGRGRQVSIDANWWKSFAARRLLTPEMGAGCLQLWGEKGTDHSLFADHCTAEYRVQTVGRGRKVEEWKLRPERPDNHWWDCLTGCAVAASVLGIQWSAAEAAGEPPMPQKPRPLRDIEEMYRKARATG